MFRAVYLKVELPREGLETDFWTLGAEDCQRLDRYQEPGQMNWGSEGILAGAPRFLNFNIFFLPLLKLLRLLKFTFYIQLHL